MSSVSVVSDISSDLGEAALWDPRTRCLHWLDLPKRRCLSLCEDANAVSERSLDVDEQLACLARIVGGLLIVSASRVWQLVGDTITPEEIALPAIDPARICFNDGKVDRHGHIWLGSPDFAEKEPLGSLWRIAPDGSAVEIGAGFIVSNGPAFSPNGRIAYFADTFGKRILAYELDDSGAPGASHVFHAGGPGFPDGLTVDAAGNVYSCRWGGAAVLVLSPSGQEIERIRVPATNVTSAAFGGGHLDRLFITTAAIECPAEFGNGNGCLYAADGFGPGIAEPLFSSAGKD